MSTIVEETARTVINSIPSVCNSVAVIGPSRVTCLVILSRNGEFCKPEPEPEPEPEQRGPKAKLSAYPLHHQTPWSPSISTHSQDLSPPPISQMQRRNCLTTSEVFLNSFSLPYRDCPTEIDLPFLIFFFPPQKRLR